MKPSNNNKFSSSLGASLIILSSFFYASYGIWTTLMGDFFDGYTASALRSVIVVIILSVIAIYYRKFEPLKLKTNWFYIIGMIIASLFTWGPLYFSILQAGVGISLAVNYASMVLGMFLFGWFFAKEQFTKDKAFAATLGIVGLVLIFSPSVSSAGWVALIAACISGLSASANAVFAKKIHYNSTQSTIILWIASVIANVMMVFVLGKPFPPFEWQVQWGYLVVFAIASIIASWSLVRGMKFIDAGIAGIIGLLEIVFGIMFGVALFQERPTVIALIGVLIVIAAAGMPYVKELNLKK